MKDGHATAGRGLGYAIETALRDLLREVVREEVRSALRDELGAVPGAAHGGTSPASMFLTTEEAAAIARVEPATVREWVRRGDLQRHHAGRELRVRRDELESFLVSGRRSEPERNVEDIALRILAKGKR